MLNLSLGRFEAGSRWPCDSCTIVEIVFVALFWRNDWTDRQMEIEAVIVVPAIVLVIDMLVLYCALVIMPLSWCSGGGSLYGPARRCARRR